MAAPVARRRLVQVDDGVGQPAGPGNKGQTAVSKPVELSQPAGAQSVTEPGCRSAPPCIWCESTSSYPMFTPIRSGESAAAARNPALQIRVPRTKHGQAGSPRLEPRQDIQKQVQPLLPRQPAHDAEKRRVGREFQTEPGQQGLAVGPACRKPVRPVVRRQRRVGFGISRFRGPPR